VLAVRTHRFSKVLIQIERCASLQVTNKGALALKTLNPNPGSLQVTNKGALALYQNLGFIRDKRLTRCSPPPPRGGSLQFREALLCLCTHIYSVMRDALVGESQELCEKGGFTRGSMWLEDL